MVSERKSSPEERTTAVGLYHYGLSYIACADMLKASEPAGMIHNAPIRFLYWHALELLMKAFLMADGLSVGDLRKRGHDQKRLHKECIERGLSLDKYPEAFFAFTDDNEPIEARYIVTGTRRLPSLDAMSDVCGEIKDAVRADLKRRELPVK